MNSTMGQRCSLLNFGSKGQRSSSLDIKVAIWFSFKILEQSCEIEMTILCIWIGIICIYWKILTCEQNTLYWDLRNANMRLPVWAMILRWPLRPVGLLFYFQNIVHHILYFSCTSNFPGVAFHLNRSRFFKQYDIATLMSSELDLDLLT